MRSLKGKMVLSYLLVALLSVLVVSALMRFLSNRSLASMVVEEQTSALSQLVQDYYASHGSLEGFASYAYQVASGAPPRPQPGDHIPPGAKNTRGVLGLVDASYRALLPTLGYTVGQTVPQERLAGAKAVQVEGQTVAWILPDSSLRLQLSPEEQLFVQRTSLATALAALAGVLAAVATGIFLAGRLLRPIRQLTAASQAMARGELHQQVAVTSRDELGQLSETFNQMSADLERAAEQRKRMTADITHDLSTPIQIISGYIEMLEAGDVSLSPQRIEIIKTELGHLRRLVGDLATLSQAEAGGLEIQLEPVQPGQLLEQVYQAFQPIAARQQVELALEADSAAPAILVDEGRLSQVLKNLLENALRHTPAGGKIRLGLAAGERVELRVEDSGEGIEAEDLPYVFERFYRADKARTSTSGKMGLGLAICRALVSAQGGRIWAESAGKGHGATLVLEFEKAPGNLPLTPP